MVPYVFVVQVFDAYRFRIGIEIISSQKGVVIGASLYLCFNDQ